MSDTQSPPRRRGPGKKPSMVNTSLRLPVDVRDFYRDRFGSNMQVQMRAILVSFANEARSLTVPTTKQEL